MYKIIKLDIHQDERGELVALENDKNIPFCIKRIFYLYNLNQEAKRAQHANKKAQQLIICLNGCCDMLLDDGKGSKANITLSRRNEAVHIQPGTWVEISNFSKECLVLVMSDSYYDRQHQINDYQEFSKTIR